MEKYPFFISIGSLVLWLASSFFMRGRYRFASRGLGLGVAFVQLGAAIWSASRVFSATPEAVEWTAKWFTVSSQLTLEFKFLVDPTIAILWLVLSSVLVVTEYFGLLGELDGDRPKSSGEGATIPLTAIGAILTLSSANLISFYFGWMLIAFAGFLAIGFGASHREDRAKAAFRFLVLNTVPKIIFLAGIIGCYAEVGTLNFHEINAATSVPSWVVFCLVGGSMLRSFQVPLMQCVRQLAMARSSAVSIFFMGYALLSPAIFLKIYPLLSSLQGGEFLALIPLVSALVSAIMLLPERDFTVRLGWLVSYLCSSVFVSGLVGDYQAALAIAIQGTIALFFLANVFSEIAPSQQGARWFVLLAALSFLGLPGFGGAWSRYLEYFGLVNSAKEISSFRWTMVSAKVLADIFIALSLWGAVKEQWFTKETSKTISWNVLLGLGLLALACLAIATGARPLSGIEGQAGLELFSRAIWFEHLILPPQGASQPLAKVLEATGTDADVIARVLVICLFSLPAVVSWAWMFRDNDAIERFREFFANNLRKIGVHEQKDPALWNWILKPVGGALGRAMVFFDNKVIEALTFHIWIKPSGWVKEGFAFFEKTILDRKLIDGLCEAVAVVGKSLRLVQNGQVQFYFALGLLLMAAVVVKFVVLGG